MSEYTTTVAAVSTPPGKGGVALIRLSGPDALPIAEKCFVPKAKKSLSSSPRTAIYGNLYSEGVAIDDALALYFPAPHSYTGEDTVEFTCHGGVLLTRTVLEALFAAGALPASAGEFTRRAFLNGRLSLTEAEAIGTLLEAKSRAQILLSSSRGRLSDALTECYRSLLSLLATAEAHIDFPEEDLGDFTDEEMLSGILSIKERIRALIETYRTGRAIREGIKTVICGRPNVGKSTLYNLLLGEEAAIVSDIAGTTRDVLEKSVPLGQVLLHLYDTAGLRKTEDPIEKIGVARAESALKEADLLLLVLDSSAPLTEEDLSLLEEAKNSPVPAILIYNKADLSPAFSQKSLSPYSPYVLCLSAKDGTTEELKSLVEALFTDEKITVGEDAVVFSARQYAALLGAEQALSTAAKAMQAGLAVDMVSADLKSALTSLGETTGLSVNEDIVSEIFSHFCVGK